MANNNVSCEEIVDSYYVAIPTTRIIRNTCVRLICLNQLLNEFDVNMKRNDNQNDHNTKN